MVEKIDLYIKASGLIIREFRSIIPLIENELMRKINREVNITLKVMEQEWKGKINFVKFSESEDNKAIRVSGLRNLGTEEVRKHLKSI